jgi:hypothetical protein
VLYDFLENSWTLVYACVGCPRMNVRHPFGVSPVWIQGDPAVTHPCTLTLKALNGHRRCTTLSCAAMGPRYDGSFIKLFSRLILYFCSSNMRGYGLVRFRCSHTIKTSTNARFLCLHRPKLGRKERGGAAGTEAEPQCV